MERHPPRQPARNIHAVGRVAKADYILTSVNFDVRQRNLNGVLTALIIEIPGSRNSNRKNENQNTA